MWHVLRPLSQIVLVGPVIPMSGGKGEMVDGFVVDVTLSLDRSMPLVRRKPTKRSEP